MKTTLLLVAALALVGGCGPDGLNPSTARPRADGAVAQPTTVHDRSDGGCGGPPEANDPSCPPDWAAARALCSQSKVCATLEKACWYPNSGDGQANGTWSTALLLCTDIHAASLGLDAGTGTWTCAQ